MLEKPNPKPETYDHDELVPSGKLVESMYRDLVDLDLKYQELLEKVDQVTDTLEKRK